MLPILKRTYDIRPLRFRDPWSPLGEELSRWLDEFWPTDGVASTKGFGSIDLYEDEKNVTVEVELPGVKRDQVELTFEDGLLKLDVQRQEAKEEEKANYYLRERMQGKWARSIRLPVTVQPDKIEATFKDGVLKVTLEKQAEPEGHKIAIK